MENKSNGNSNGIPSEKVMTVTRFTCSSCKKQLTAKAPGFRITNHVDFSSITCVHQIPVKCSCETYYIPIITGLTSDLKLVLSWKVVQVAQSSSVENEVPDLASTLKQ